MLNAIGDSLSDHASSYHGSHGEDENDEEELSEQGQLSKDDDPGWVMGTTSKSVQHHMERFRQKLMMLDKLTHLGWEDAANYFPERDMRYGTAKLMVPAFAKPQTNMVVAEPSPTILGEPMESHDAVLRKLQMPQVTSGPGSNQMRLGARKPQSHKCVASLPPDAAPNSSPIKTLQLVKPVSIYPCKWSPKLNTWQESVSEEQIATAAASPEQQMNELQFLTTYLFEMRIVYLFCPLSACRSFQWPNCKTWKFICACARVVWAMRKF